MVNIVDVLAEIRNELSKINKSLKSSEKNVMTIDEVAEYTGLKKSTIYNMTYGGRIPHYKPFGKNVYFDRKEIEKWIKQRENEI